MADQIITKRWLIDLGRVVAKRASQADVEDFIDTMAPMLARRFPNETFCFVSLEYVAAELLYLPTYGELIALLRNWKRSLPAPSYPAINDNVIDLPQQERQWLRYYHAREAEGFAPLREPDGRLSRPEITDWREHTLSLIRQYAPSAWYYIRRDNHAA